MNPPPLPWSQLGPKPPIRLHPHHAYHSHNSHHSDRRHTTAAVNATLAANAVCARNLTLPPSVVHEPARAAKRIEPPRDSSLLEPARVVLFTSRLEAPPDSRTRAQFAPGLERNRADSSPELSGCPCMLPFSFETKQKLNTRHLNINTVDLFPLAMYPLHR